MHLSTKIYRVRITVVAILFYVFLFCLYFIIAVLLQPVYNTDTEYQKYNIRTKTYMEDVRIKTVDTGYKINGVPFRRLYFYTKGNGICSVDTKDMKSTIEEEMIIESKVTDILLLYNDKDVIDRTLVYTMYFDDSVVDLMQIKGKMLETVTAIVSEAEREYTVACMKRIIVVGFIFTLIYIFLQGVRIRLLTKQYEEMRILSMLEETEHDGNE